MPTTFEPQRRQRRAGLVSGLMLCLVAQATAAWGLEFNVTLASLTNHNTSAHAAYNRANFGANFGTSTWIDQSGTTMPVDPTKMDLSLNPITPGHVSKMDVHTLIPGRPDLRWFAHATPWFGGSSHINIGINCDTTSYVAAMVTDMKNRGFNGVVINWYGQGHTTDGVTQKLKAYLAGIPNNTFTYILMADKGLRGGLTTSNLQYQLEYAKSQYFVDPNYEREPVNTGLPILMFFGVRTVLGSAAMSSVKANLGGNMVWVEQGTSYLSEPWEDQCFEWSQQFNSGVNPNDPFNLAGVVKNFPAIRTSGKKAFGALCGNFNGMLTKTVDWSMGKYLPSSNGLCMVQRALTINSQIPANMTRMQWVTWNDWEEGSQVETGLENNFALTAQVNTPNVLSWVITSGDERTIDHYEVYASTNGVNLALLGSVPAGIRQTNLSQLGVSAPGAYQLYVDAIGKPCIRDHMSQPVSALLVTAPLILADLQPLAQLAWQGDPVSFTVTAAGTPPLSYQWTLNGQNIPGATNASYSFAARAGTNGYAVTVSNAQGSASSSTGVVTGLAATYLDPANFNAMRITFSGYTNGVGLTNFPALVRLSPAIPGFSYAQFASPGDGADLRFATASGRELPFQIDQWNPAGESQVWVQVPALTSSSDYIVACWGNWGARAMPPCNRNGAVWTLGGSNNFLLVYHLSESDFPFADSTLQYPATSGGRPDSTPGIVGSGCAFNGGAFLDAGLVNIGKTFTLSAWVNLSPALLNEHTLWCNKKGGWNTAGFDFYVNSFQTSDGKVYFDTADGTGGNVSARTAASAVSFGQWHLLTGVMDGVNGVVRVYVDGVDRTINTGVNTAFQVTNYVRCGALLTGAPGVTGSLPFNGAMDEARIESGVRSPAWIWASWATVASSAFATYGPVVPPTVALQHQLVDGKLVLTWAAGALQSSPALDGAYSDIPGASSPYTNALSINQQYFRVRVR